jgi:hypothetical protein
LRAIGLLDLVQKGKTMAIHAKPEDHKDHDHEDEYNDPRSQLTADVIPAQHEEPPQGEDVKPASHPEPPQGEDVKPAGAGIAQSEKESEDDEDDKPAPRKATLTQE